MHDRIRAKPPKNDVDSWESGVIKHVDSEASSRTVTVTPDGTDDEVELHVTEAVYNLFTSRLDGDEPVGQTVYYKQKGT